MVPSPGTPELQRRASAPPGPRSARARTLRLIALSSGAVIAVTASPPAVAQPAQPARQAATAARPGPGGDQVAESERRVRERAAEVGRIKARVAQADGELARLAAAAESAVERYNGELVQLRNARQSYADTQRRGVEAAHRLDEAQKELASFAANAYRVNTGFNQIPSAIAGNGGPQGYMDRAAMVEVLARRRTAIVRRVEAVRNVADVFRRQAHVTLDEQASATRRAADAKNAAHAAVARQRAAVQRIGAEKRRLEQRLGSARARASALQRARVGARERAEAAKARSGVGEDTERGAVAARAALRWLGTAYSWGGGTVNGPSYGVDHGARIYGFDCSGLAMYAWDKAGVRLDHWTGSQWTSGPHVPLGSLRAGDLVFFARNTSDPRTIHHVGIYLRRGRMVEAPYTGARVRISSIYRNDLIGATRPAG
ncbi:NlpC/P60 family protein [Actinomadura sp. J1-007]|nr:NlpC/P60 family protein [Actinomadura sp. J1-007]